MAANNNNNENTALVRVQYDPSVQDITGAMVNKFVSPIRVARYDEKGRRILIVRLTAAGNKALQELCHTNEQKEVWRFPSYEFEVVEGSLKVSQFLTHRPSYVNALLIASRGIKVPSVCTNNKKGVFPESVRLPGWWGGCCAGCKWMDGAAKCSYGVPGEDKFMPTSLAPLPRAIIEDLED